MYYIGSFGIMEVIILLVYLAVFLAIVRFIWFLGSWIKKKVNK